MQSVRHVHSMACADELVMRLGMCTGGVMAARRATRLLATRLSRRARPATLVIGQRTSIGVPGSGREVLSEGLLSYTPVLSCCAG